MKFESFSKTNLPAVRSEIEAALAAIGEKYGIQFNFGNISYSDNQFSTKLSAHLGELKSKKDIYKENWLQWAGRFGMNISDLGKTFSDGRKTLKIVGLDMKQRKKVIIVESEGKEFKATPEQISYFLK